MISWRAIVVIASRVASGASRVGMTRLPRSRISPRRFVKTASMWLAPTSTPSTVRALSRKPTMMGRRPPFEEPWRVSSTMPESRSSDMTVETVERLSPVLRAMSAREISLYSQTSLSSHVRGVSRGG